MEGLLLACFVFAYVFQKAWSTARTEHELAKHNTIPPRMLDKYGEAGARAKVAKYGFRDYFKDAYRDLWARRTDALIAARDERAEEAKGAREKAKKAREEGEAAEAPPAQTEKVRFRDRIDAAKRTLNAGYRRVVDPVPVVTSDAPTAPGTAPPADNPVPLLVDTGDVPVDTIRYSGTDRERWTGSEWEPIPTPQPPSAPPAGLAVPPPSTQLPVEPATAEPGTVPDSADTPTTPSGETVTPTGEAVNYETAVAELEALEKEQQAHLDSCVAALSHIEGAKTQIDTMQSSYRTSAEAAGSMHEHLAAMNLDGVTLSHTGTIADAMPPNAVDAWFAQLEEMEATAKERRDAAEAALGATQAALGTIQSKYGDAHATVAGELGGNAAFLDSGGTTTSVGGGGDNSASGPAGATPNPGSPASPAAEGGGTGRVTNTVGPVHADTVHFGTHIVTNR